MPHTDYLETTNCCPVILAISSAVEQSATNTVLSRTTSTLVAILRCYHVTFSRYQDMFYKRYEIQDHSSTKPKPIHMCVSRNVLGLLWLQIHGSHPFEHRTVQKW